MMDMGSERKNVWNRENSNNYSKDDKKKFSVLISFALCIIITLLFVISIYGRLEHSISVQNIMSNMTEVIKETTESFGKMKSLLRWLRKKEAILNKSPEFRPKAENIFDYTSEDVPDLEYN